MEASNAKDGHRAYLQKHPDVTVVDVMLPDLTGFELTRLIRRDDPAAKLVRLHRNRDNQDVPPNYVGPEPTRDSTLNGPK